MAELADATLEQRLKAAHDLLRDQLRDQRVDVDGPLLLSYVVWPNGLPWRATVDAMDVITCKREDCHEPSPWARGPYAHLCRAHADEKRIGAGYEPVGEPVSDAEATDGDQAIDVPPIGRRPENGSQRIGDLAAADRIGELAAEVVRAEIALDEAQARYRAELEAELARLA